MTQELFGGRLPHWTLFRQPKFHVGLGITAATAVAALLVVLAPTRRERAGRAH